MSYQPEDREIIDYQLTLIPGTEFVARAPLPSRLDGSALFICAMGAAQTFGRFAERPFLNLLGKRLDVETFNLGAEGGGPGQYLRRPNVLEIANRSSLVILQVMSGRSVSNSYFENVYAGSLRPWSAPDDEPQHAETAYSKLYNEKGEDFIRPLIAETRNNYLNQYMQLIAAIRAPTLLFWFSQRETNYQERYPPAGARAAGAFLGAFPQLVTGEMVAKLRPHVNSYVECITSRGLPQLLRNRKTGEIVDLGISPLHPGCNNYYPSPDMHADAAEALEPAARALLEKINKSWCARRYSARCDRNTAGSVE